MLDTREGSIEDVTDDLLRLNEEIHDRCQDNREDCNGWKFTDGTGVGEKVDPFDLDESFDICKAHVEQDKNRMIVCADFFGLDTNSLTEKEGSQIAALRKNASIVGVTVDPFDYDEYIRDCADDYSALGGPESPIAEKLLKATVREMDRDCLGLCFASDCTHCKFLLLCVPNHSNIRCLIFLRRLRKNIKDES